MGSGHSSSRHYQQQKQQSHLFNSSLNQEQAPSGKAYPTQQPAYPVQQSQVQMPPQNSAPCYVNQQGYAVAGAPPPYAPPGQLPPNQYAGQAPPNQYAGQAPPNQYAGQAPPPQQYIPQGPQTVVVSGGFDAGARFDGHATANIPPPPPGHAPNAAQMAQMQGHSVVATQRQGDYITGGSDGGYTIW